jgi:trk system potassium uptake protein TrkA
MPRGDFVLTEGDRIFVTAPTANLALLLKNLGVTARRVKSVLIAGGGKVSFYLAQRLLKAGMSVKIIEKDHDRCLELSEMLPEATILEGDCADRSDLEDMGLLRCDAFLSLTGVDEMNMITSLYALSRGVPQVITKLGRAGSTDLADAMNLGSVVCPRDLCGNEIVRYVRAMENQSGAAISVHSIADGQAEATEFTVDEQTPGIRTPLKELKLRKGVLIAIIARHGKVEVPGGDSQMLPGDTVVLVTPANAAPQTLSEIFL